MSGAMEGWEGEVVERDMCPKNNGPDYDSPDYDGPDFDDPDFLGSPLPRQISSTVAMLVLQISAIALLQ